jgi:hypothetical protein
MVKIDSRFVAYLNQLKESGITAKARGIGTPLLLVWRAKTAGGKLHGVKPGSIARICRALNKVPTALPLRPDTIEAVEAELRLSREGLKLLDSHPLQLTHSQSRWGLHDPTKLHICLGADLLEEEKIEKKEKEYIKPVIGLGQAEALATLLVPLVAAYPRINDSNLIVRSYDPNLDQIHRDDFIALGSGDANSEGGQLLIKFNRGLKRWKSRSIAARRELAPKIEPGDLGSIEFVNDSSGTPIKKMVIKRKRTPPCELVKYRETFHADVQEKRVTLDFGIALRMPNPFRVQGKRTTSFLFGGLHTFGTAAAARWFVDLCDPDLIRDPNTALLAIVGCEVRNDRIRDPELFEIYLFDTA